MLALSAHPAGRTSLPRRRAMIPAPELEGAQDLASLEPRNGDREDVEGADEEEERAHGDGTTAAT